MAQQPTYSERLWVPLWWWLVGVGIAALLALEVDRGIGRTPALVTLVVLIPLVAWVLLWLSRFRVEVRDGELWAGQAHLPREVIARSALVPKTAKSAALGRQLDPAAYVQHRAWVGPMVLVVLDDPDDPTPYWLVSTRHPDRLLAALS